jgi:hypothetical protein
MDSSLHVLVTSPGQPGLLTPLRPTGDTWEPKYSYMSESLARLGSWKSTTGTKLEPLIDVFWEQFLYFLITVIGKYCMSGWPSCLQHVKLLLFCGYQNYRVIYGQVLLFAILVYVRRVPGLSRMKSGSIIVLTLLTSTLRMRWGYTSAPSTRANTGMSSGDACLYIFTSVYY